MNKAKAVVLLCAVSWWSTVRAEELTRDQCFFYNTLTYCTWIYIYRDRSLSKEYDVGSNTQIIITQSKTHLFWQIIFTVTSQFDCYLLTAERSDTFVCVCVGKSPDCCLFGQVQSVSNRRSSVDKCCFVSSSSWAVGSQPGEKKKTLAKRRWRADALQACPWPRRGLSIWM